jgi:hypothetical protein
MSVPHERCERAADQYPAMVTVAPGATRDFVTQRRLEPHLVLGTPPTPPFPEEHEVAIVGMGCFWRPMALIR